MEVHEGIHGPLQGHVDAYTKGTQMEFTKECTF